MQAKLNRADNPYAPGAGRQPPSLAGRDVLLENAATDFDRLARRKPVKGLMLLGLRGVGKTVLMNRLRAVANERGLKSIKIEAPEGGKLPALLGPAMRTLLYDLDLTKAAGNAVRKGFATLRNFVGTFDVALGPFSVSVEPAPGRADTGDLELDLTELLCAIGEAAAEQDTAAVLFIDEVQYLAPAELAALVAACHEIAQRDLPFMFVGAGLPQIAALAGKAKSYAERLFDYPEIGPLDPDAADQAIAEPATAEGVAFGPGALDEVRAATAGYPYFLQEWGYHLWNFAPGSPITAEHVRRVSPEVVAHLDASFFRVRFDRLTAAEQRYLRAMAELGDGPYQTSDIANVLGVESPSIATVRRNLITKGMVWSQRYGETAFTVPLFGAYMHRRMPTLEKHVPRRRRGPPG